MITNTALEKEKYNTPKKKIFHNIVYDSPFPELEHCEKFNSIVECNYFAHDSDLESRFDSMCDFLNKKTHKIEKYSTSLFEYKTNELEHRIDKLFDEKEIITKIDPFHRSDLLKRNYIGIEREKQLNRMMFFLNTYKLKTRTTLKKNLFENNLFESKEDESEYLSLIDSLINNTDFNQKNDLQLNKCKEHEDYEMPENYECEYEIIDDYEPYNYQDAPKDIFYECITEISDGNLLIDNCDKYTNINNYASIFETKNEQHDYTNEVDISEIKKPNYISGFYELIEDTDQNKINITDSVKNVTYENDKLYKFHIRNSNDIKKPNFFLNFEQEARQEKAEFIAHNMIADLAERNIAIESDPKKKLCEVDKIMSEARILGIV